VVLGSDLFGLLEVRITAGDHLGVVDVLVRLDVGVAAKTAANESYAIFCHNGFS
jgi:hypothetical protein